MADTGKQKVTAAFPPPPPFWKHFTSQNLQKLEEYKEEQKDKLDGIPKKEWTPEALHMLELPAELRYLVPPKAPTAGSYSLFGESQTVILVYFHAGRCSVVILGNVLIDCLCLKVSISLPSLQDQGIEQLYPDPPAGAALPPNPRFYLLKISKSLLLNFLEFVGVLSLCPEQFESKVQDIRNLFVNAHHLLNLYRPHQARESLIMMMEEQLERSREEIREMDRVKEKVQGFLEQLEAEGVSVGGGGGGTVDEKKAKENSRAEEEVIEEARAMWNLLDEIDED
ncbi:Mediator of RNA polymerase II transcription subunit 7 [Onygenales sp. PD_40]|nr:Mediator of RNA polymerase II transcription subunit 7 [Onygenales sp. PD_40]